MNRKLLASALSLPLLLSCSGKRVESNREEILSFLKDAKTLFAEVLVENPFPGYSFHGVSYNEDEEASILILGYDIEEDAFYLDGDIGEEHLSIYGGPVEAEEEGEEPSYHVVVLNDEEEWEEVEDENEILALRASFSLALLNTLELNYNCLENCYNAFSSLDEKEEEVASQYADDEDEVEVGDIYLDILGEIYYQEGDSIGAGISYEYGVIAEIEEGEEGEDPTIIYEEDGFEDGKYAFTLDLVEDDYCLTDYRDKDSSHYKWSYEFEFSDPTIEEE